jgi:hypothetical protein
VPLIEPGPPEPLVWQLLFICLGVGSQCAAHRVETLEPEGIRVRDPSGRAVWQQADGAVGEPLETRGVGNQPSAVRGRCWFASTSTHTTVSCRKFRCVTSHLLLDVIGNSVLQCNPLHATSEKADLEALTLPVRIYGRKQVTAYCWYIQPSNLLWPSMKHLHYCGNIQIENVNSIYSVWRWFINITIATQLNSINLSVPNRKHIMSPLRAQQVNAIYRLLTTVY